LVENDPRVRIRAARALGVLGSAVAAAVVNSAKALKTEPNVLSSAAESAFFMILSP
jgi:HEAT repeat protein